MLSPQHIFVNCYIKCFFTYVFTASVQSITGGYVFTGVCLFTGVRGYLISDPRSLLGRTEASLVFGSRSLAGDGGVREVEGERKVLILSLVLLEGALHLSYPGQEYLSCTLASTRPMSLAILPLAKIRGTPLTGEQLLLCHGGKPLAVKQKEFPVYLFVSEKFPRSCVTECRCYSNRHHKTFVANCSYSSLTELPDSLPKHTDWLLLSGNNISSLKTEKEETNDTFYHLSQLDLHGNNLANTSAEMVDGFMQTNSLLYLDLSNNELSSLPDNIKNLTSLKTLKISGNNFKCSCKSFWMKDWLLNETKVVEGFENIKCQMKSGKWIGIVHMDKVDMGCVPSAGEPLSTWQIAGTHFNNHFFTDSN